MGQTLSVCYITYIKQEVFCIVLSKKQSEYDQELQQSHTAD